MERSLMILLFLGNALLTAECFYSFARRQEGPTGEPVFQADPCISEVRQCTSPLLEQLYNAEEPTDSRVVITHIDNICEQYFTARECVTSSYTICPESFRQRADHLINAADYVCSERGKELVKEYQQSVCYEDAAKLHEFQDVLRICRTGVDPGPENVCQAAIQVFQCGSTWLTNECGTAAGQFFDGLASRLLPLVARQDCSSENANAVLKRGLELLKRSL